MAIISVFILLVSLGVAGSLGSGQAPRRDMEAKLEALVAELKAVQPLNQALRDELVAMGKEDQRLRGEGQKLWEAKGPDSPESKAVWDRQAVLDRTNQARLKEIVAEHGWPGVKLVGLSGADAAFLIAQHADLKTQSNYLPMVEAAVKRREALPFWAAMLEDRVLVGEGKPQVYGTQVRMQPGSTKWELLPIRDERRVDARREAVLLGPLAQYLKDFGIEYKPPKK
jgi:hypothetical protein